jgi:hypothetical protein
MKVKVKVGDSGGVWPWAVFSPVDKFWDIPHFGMFSLRMGWIGLELHMSMGLMSSGHIENEIASPKKEPEMKGVRDFGEWCSLFTSC